MRGEGGDKVVLDGEVVGLWLWVACGRCRLGRVEGGDDDVSECCCC